jgi:hypothetical protein
LATGPIDGAKHASVLDQNLFSHVHTFFMHAGTARDYLGWLIASRLGLKADALSRLGREIRQRHFGTDTLLDALLQRQLLRPHVTKTSEWIAAGWLEELGDLRKKFIHKRPYGSHPAERWGTTTAVSASHGFYRYTRPVASEAGNDGDILDLIAGYYHFLNDLFEDMATLTGYNCAPRTFTDSDLQVTDAVQQPGLSD